MTDCEITIHYQSETGKNIVPEVIQLASQYDSTIYFLQEGQQYNAKSMMGMLLLNPREGMQLHLLADGADEQEASEAVEAFLGVSAHK